MTDGDETDRPQEDQGGWLPPSAPGAEGPPTWQQAPPERPGVEGLPPADSPLAGIPTGPPPAQGTPQPPPPAYPPPYPQAPPPGQYGPPPAGYGYPQPQPGWYQPPPARPTNGSAVAALVLGISGIVVTLMFAGFLFIVSLPCSIAAWILGVKGKKAATRDPQAEPMRPAGWGMAQAGFICGIVGVVLAILAIILWIVVFAATDWNFDEFEPAPDEELFESRLGLLRLIAPAARLLLGLG